MSDLEEKVMKVLKKDGIYFEREKTFSDLRKGKYRFDFYCPYVEGGGAIVEVQGQQHYQQIKKFHSSLKDFKAGQERDRRKISYCLANSIPIYCIPYWEVDSIKKSSDIFQEKYRAKTKWKNDVDWKNFNS